MMFYVIQSNDTDKLVEHLLAFYQNSDQQNLFEPFMVIVPSMVLGDWLTKAVAKRAGISTLFATQFWGQYQWQITQTVLELDAKAYPHEALAVPEVAVLSASIMRWRIFNFLTDSIATELEHIIQDDKHYLHFLLKPLLDQASGLIPEHRLWQVCDELASVYVRYLTHRPEWLLAWARGESLADEVSAMMADKARFERKFAGESTQNKSNKDELDKDKEDSEALPEWLQEYYLSLERVLGFLWWQLFSQMYLYRTSLEERFWQVLAGERGRAVQERAMSALPKKLYLFTVQQIPQVELAFLQRLSLYLDVVLLHFNPSMLFWADIVDKNWLLTQRIIRPQSVYLKDYGHGLLSRLGKESRETFAMLADMSGGQFSQTWQINWQDDFVSPMDKHTPTLLNALKQDILMLDDSQMSVQHELAKNVLSGVSQEQFSQASLSQKSRPKVALPMSGADSLSIHACHSLRRQLEIARLMIAKYLNEPAKKRQLSDVVVLLPDVAVAKDLIRSVFPEGRGVDGLYLPIKITGVPDKSVEELVQAIMGFYELLGEPSSRFYAKEVYEWLLTPALFESFGLSFEQMKRACDLLERAGFKRGFDQEHLSATLDGQDLDYRYSFSYALDRIVLGLLSPSDHEASTTMHPFVWQAGSFAEAVLPLAGVSLVDEPIVSALTAIYQGLLDNRDKYQRVDKVETILGQIEEGVINRYFALFHQSQAMRAIFNTKNMMMVSLRANKYYHRQLTHYQTRTANNVYQNRTDVYLSTKFVLKSLAQTVKSQAISAETAQVITFARFGALRSVPFGLTIMLDMNLSAFPRQDKSVSMDLMQAGLKRRGDRYNEDDDNGAFLDALLCTKDKVAIFYNGISPDGKNLLLPASPVGELIQFLKTDALWRFEDLSDEQNHQQKGEQHKLSTLIRQSLPRLIEHYLITYHEVSAFDRGVFYYQDEPSLPKTDDEYAWVMAYLHDKLTQLKRHQKQYLPPVPLWQSVRAVLDKSSQENNNQENKTIVQLPTQAWLDELAEQLQNSWTLFAQGVDDKAMAEHWRQFASLFNIILEKQNNIKNIIHCANHLGKNFLADKILIQINTDSVDPDEPLALDGLQSYQLNELLLQALHDGVLDGQDLNALSKIELSKSDLSKVQWLYSLPNLSPSKQSPAQKRLNSIYYGDLLPAGVLRFQTPSRAIGELGKHLEMFLGYLKTHQEKTHQHKFMTDDIRRLDLSDTKYSTLITPVSSQTVPLSFGELNMTLSGDLPKDDVWLNILPSSAKAKHLLAFWLRHLLWQVARKSTFANDGTGVSIWYFLNSSDGIAKYRGKQAFALPAIDWQLASMCLMNWWILVQITKHMPLVITTESAMLYQQYGDDISQKVLKGWLQAPYQQSYQQYIPEDNNLHQYWQMILGDNDAFATLKQHLPIVAPLFKTMEQYLISLN